MLAIARPSPFSNKFVIAAIVFSIGFIGSLSILRLLQPGLGPLASSHVGSLVSHSNSPAPGSTQANTANSGSKQATSAADTNSGETPPVSPIPVDPPTSSYTNPSPAAGTAQLSGQVAPANQSPAPSPATVTQPATSTVTQPSAPTPSTSSLAAPVTSLAQPVTNTATNLLPPLSTCTCGN